MISVNATENNITYNKYINLRVSSSHARQGARCSVHIPRLSHSKTLEIGVFLYLHSIDEKTES